MKRAVPALLNPEEKSGFRRSDYQRLTHVQAGYSRSSSIEYKIQPHIRLIAKLKYMLQVSKTALEIAFPDTQKARNPEISGTEYHLGEFHGYETREYLREKFFRECMCCGKINAPLEIEYLAPRSKGGFDTVENLSFACHSCTQEKNSLITEEFVYITKRNYVSLGNDKSHANDALVILGGITQTRSTVFNVKHRRRSNFSLQTNGKGLPLPHRY